jgi:hypothetical protein
MMISYNRTIRWRNNAHVQVRGGDIASDLSLSALPDREQHLDCLKEILVKLGNSRENMVLWTCTRRRVLLGLIFFDGR